MTPSAFAPFRNRDYLAYWLTGLAANFGWLIQLVGASWLMTSLGGTPEQVALVQTAVALPIVLFSLPAGAVADALGRRTLILWAQGFLLAVSLLLALCAFLGWLTPWWLLIFTFLVGSGKAISNPGWQTMVSEFMPRTELPGAIAMNSVGFNIARSVGPAIGGAIVATVGAFAAFVVNAVSNLGVILLAWRWPRATDTARDLPPESVGGAMLAGMRYVALSPTLLQVILRGTALNLTGISVLALMPLIARDLLDGGPRTFGFLLGAFGVGAIIGAFVIDRARRLLALEPLIRTSVLVFAGAALILALSRSVGLTLLGAALAGGSWMISMSTLQTVVQTASPRWVLSRTHALYQTCAFFGNALGSWVWGALAGSLGLANALVASSVALVAAAALGLRWGLREFDALKLDPHSSWTAPPTALDILPKSGPILTIIEYRIREADVPAFLAAMTERRRNRIRDGAQLWTLSRDIQDPERWTERYKSPTWAEHHRHVLRRTVAGAELARRIHALHQGEGKPSVRYELVRHPPASNGAFLGGVDT